MKKTTLYLASMCLSTLLIGQKGTNEVYSATATNYALSPKISEMEIVSPVQKDGKHYIVPNKLRRNKAVNPNALPNGMDPALQRNYNTHRNRIPLVQWEGLDRSDGGATPPDPSGAAGPNHYIEMVNTAWEIFDKNGTSLYGPANLGSIWAGIGFSGVNDGDPIVMYDRFVDRWFLSQFRLGSANTLLVAVSQTSDPLGNYHLYEFTLDGNLPDYPKYGIWTDGYYITANKSGDEAYVLERDKIIAGDPTAQVVGMQIPQKADAGFFSVLPATANKDLPPLGTPGYLFYFQDDAWGGVSSDHIKVWEIDVDWNNTANTTISNPIQIPVSPFDSEFNQWWNDIEQPGTNAKLDGIPGAFMYPANFMNFTSHSSVVLNHTVDINGSDHAGIRWYELRLNAGVWSLHQEGTYAPDNQNRWNGSICQDEQGNIGLAYSVSGSTVYPSIRYTGRLSSDPLGTMSLAETNVFTGTSVQTNTNRFGDYAHMSLDPDNKTFWYVGEFISNNWKTGIFSFKLASDYDDDIGVSALINPTDGMLTATENIEVTITNYGTQDQSNFPVSFQIDGATPVTETYSGTLTAGTSANYTFTAAANLSVQGPYEIISYTGLVGDQENNNDTTVVTVTHLYANDLGVTAVAAPQSGGSLGMETITVMIENFGTQDQSNFDVAYVIDGGAPVIETVTAIVTAGGSYSYDFTGTYDFSNVGVYNAVAYTSLVNDDQYSNDTTTTQIEKTFCQPSGNCSSGDGFRLFQLGIINNSTGCSSNGYGDFTNLSTDLARGQTHTLSVQSDWSQQHGTVWIDFNDNFVFEPSEMVVDNHIFGTAVSNTSMAIPANAALGQHLMRARTNWQSDIDDPCINVNYGETEDYTVNIIDFNSLEEQKIQSELKVARLDQNNFQLFINGFNGNLEIEIMNSLGQLVYQSGKIQNGTGEITHRINMSDKAEGMYLIKVFNKDNRIVRKIVKD